MSTEITVNEYYISQVGNNVLVNIVFVLRTLKEIQREENITG